jgi:hypothetical protein
MTTFLRILSILSFLVPSLLGLSLRSSFKSSDLIRVSGKFYPCSSVLFRFEPSVLFRFEPSVLFRFEPSVLFCFEPSVLSFYSKLSKYQHRELCQKTIWNRFLFAEIKSSTCDKLDRCSN